MSTTKKKYYIYTLLTLTLIFINTSSRTLLIQASHQNIPFAQRDTFRIPSSTTLRTLTLNYTSFASSLIWIGGLIYFGDWQLSKPRTPPKHLQSYASLARNLDADFIGIYNWLNAVYINSHHLPHRLLKHEDLEFLREFNEEGMQRHPDNWELPYTTGMNYIGYSYKRSKKERLIELDHSIKHLKTCSKLTQCPTHTPFTVSYLYKLKNSLSNADSPQKKDEKEFYIDLYKQTTTTSTQKRIELKLIELGMSKKEIISLIASTSQKIEADRKFSKWSYLPLDAWTLIVYPTEGGLATLAAEPRKEE